jgi:acetoin utilization deacetylase AcuC-like enzyme
MNLHAYYTDRFVLPLPPGHRFPMRKYQLTREMALARVPTLELLEPEPATDGQLALAHTASYIDRVSRGLLSPAEQREIGFPWSLAMVERSRRSVGATIGACRSALPEGVAVNLAGGTHHAYVARGSGFCVFNDVVVAARLIQTENLGRTNKKDFRVAIVDLDVHQGNGTASILRDDPSVFTLSLHGEKNFPFRKEASDLDVGLPDGAGDSEYLAALDGALDRLFERFSPDLMIYLAGADPYEGDRLGRLKMTVGGLEQRDRKVFAAALERGIPVAVTMAGGYGRVIEETCAVHAQTVAVAAEFADRYAAHWLADPASGRVPSPPHVRAA